MIGKTYGVALVLCAALAMGCSAGGDPDPSGPEGRTSSAPPALAEDPVELPKHMQWVEHELDLRFGVPKTWTVIHGDSVDDPANAGAIEEHAKTLAWATSIVRANLRLSDYLVVGRRESIYVGGSRHETVPTEDELQAEAAREGWRASIDTIYTDLGEGALLYSGTPRGRAVVSILFVEAPNGIAELVAITPNWERATYVMTEIVRTLTEGDVSDV